MPRGGAAEGGLHGSARQPRLGHRSRGRAGADRAVPVHGRASVRCRGIPQPGEWRRRERRIGYEQRVEFSKLRGGRSASKASAARLRARARPAMAVRSTTAGAENDLCGPQRCDDAGDNRRARSVLQADCAAASIMKGRSALLGGRKPSVVGSFSALVGHRLRPSRVIREGGRNSKPRRQPLDKNADRLLHVRQPHPRMEKVLNAACRDQVIRNGRRICFGRARCLIM